MNKIWNQLLLLAEKIWRRQTLIVFALFTLLFAIFIVLSNIPENASLEEHQAAQSSSSIKAIIENPVNAPYKIAAFGLTSYIPSIKLMRAVSYVFYFAACIALFYTLRHWHTLQTSVLTTAAFATNSLVLATGRLGTPLVTVMSFFIFASLLLWQLHSRSNKFVPAIVLISLACLLYTPGAFWFLLILGIVYWNRFKKLFLNVKRQAIIIGASISILLVAPLIVSFISDTANLFEWLLLPETLVWSNIPSSILQVPSAFIYKMQLSPIINVSNLPVFDLSAGILFLIGINAYRRKFKLDRTKVMLACALMGVLVGAFGELLLAITFILPFAYGVIAAGIEFLLDEWYSIFPRNPLARSFGLIMVTSVVLFSIYYQTTRFFVVWPQTPETRRMYDLTRIIDESSAADTIK